MGTKTQALGHNYEQQWGGEAETKWLGFNENYLENSIIFLPIQQFSYFQAFHFSPFTISLLPGVQKVTKKYQLGNVRMKNLSISLQSRAFCLEMSAFL